MHDVIAKVLSIKSSLPDPISVITWDASNLNCRQELYKLALQHAYGPTVD